MMNYKGYPEYLVPKVLPLRFFLDFLFLVSDFPLVSFFSPGFILSDLYLLQKFGFLIPDDLIDAEYAYETKRSFIYF